MRRGLHALVCLLLLTSFSISQETPVTQSAPAAAAGNQAPAPAKPRLKIGVALEGGGALGLAHIGVLQWFEDHHIPIDYLAGTSMGGLVGGLLSVCVCPGVSPVGWLLGAHAHTLLISQ